ncbi:hypothetical protein SNEBB_005938 [Seison nebaliae]|nr:hypothetical protein SNEBB_005938 [Seison nebaliae]
MSHTESDSRSTDFSSNLEEESTVEGEEPTIDSGTATPSESSSESEASSPSSSTTSSESLEASSQSNRRGSSFDHQSIEKQFYSSNYQEEQTLPDQFLTAQQSFLQPNSNQSQHYYTADNFQSGNPSDDRNYRIKYRYRVVKNSRNSDPLESFQEENRSTTQLPTDYYSDLEQQPIYQTPEFLSEDLYSSRRFSRSQDSYQEIPFLPIEQQYSTEHFHNSAPQQQQQELNCVCTEIFDEQPNLNKIQVEATYLPETLDGGQYPRAFVPIFNPLDLNTLTDNKDYSFDNIDLPDTFDEQIFFDSNNNNQDEMHQSFDQEVICMPVRRRRRAGRSNYKVAQSMDFAGDYAGDSYGSGGWNQYQDYGAEQYGGQVSGMYGSSAGMYGSSTGMYGSSAEMYSGSRGGYGGGYGGSSAGMGYDAGFGGRSYDDLESLSTYGGADYGPMPWPSGSASYGTFNYGQGGGGGGGSAGGLTGNERFIRREMVPAQGADVPKYVEVWTKKEKKNYVQPQQPYVQPTMPMPMPTMPTYPAPTQTYRREERTSKSRKKKSRRTTESSYSGEVYSKTKKNMKDFKKEINEMLQDALGSIRGSKRSSPVKSSSSSSKKVVVQPIQPVFYMPSTGKSSGGAAETSSSNETKTRTIIVPKPVYVPIIRPVFVPRDRVIVKPQFIQIPKPVVISGGGGGGGAAPAPVYHPPSDQKPVVIIQNPQQPAPAPERPVITERQQLPPIKVEVIQPPQPQIPQQQQGGQRRGTRIIKREEYVFRDILPTAYGGRIANISSGVNYGYRPCVEKETFVRPEMTQEGIALPGGLSLNDFDRIDPLEQQGSSSGSPYGSGTFNFPTATNYSSGFDGGALGGSGGDISSYGRLEDLPNSGSSANFGSESYGDLGTGMAGGIASGSYGSGFNSMNEETDFSQLPPDIQQLLKNEPGTELKSYSRDTANPSTRYGEANFANIPSPLSSSHNALINSRTSFSRAPSNQQIYRSSSQIPPTNHNDMSSSYFDKPNDMNSTELADLLNSSSNFDDNLTDGNDSFMPIIDGNGARYVMGGKNDSDLENFSDMSNSDNIHGHITTTTRIRFPASSNLSENFDSNLMNNVINFN